MKKKIPLSILEALQPLVDNNLELIKPVKDDASMFHLVDKDGNSDFYFKVLKQEVRQGKIFYVIDYKPSSRDFVKSYVKSYKIEDVLTILKKWLGILRAYDKIHTVYDDPILFANQKRFEKEFTLVDEDADTASFDLGQQIFLDDYLNTAKSKLKELQKGRSEQEVIELKELVLDATEIQDYLTKATKQEIIKMLSKFWAKAQKAGLDVIREVFVGLAGEITKRLLNG